MKNFADLQVHSKYSDGVHDPIDLLTKADSLGIKAISFTDHNYLLPSDVIEAIFKEAKIKGITFVEGLEISASHDGKDFHLLTYSKRFERAGLIEAMLASVHADYNNRGYKVLEQLASEGYELSADDFKNIFHTYLHKNMIARIAFEKYGVPVDYVKKMKLLDGVRMVEFQNLVPIIKKAKGVTVLAHPGDLYKKLGDKFEEFILELVSMGLDGIEIYHYKNTDPNMLEILRKIAEEHRLLITGGSDYHSDADSIAKIGEYGLSSDEFQKFYERL